MCYCSCIITGESFSHMELLWNIPHSNTSRSCTLLRALLYESLKKEIHFFPLAIRKRPAREEPKQNGSRNAKIGRKGKGEIAIMTRPREGQPQNDEIREGSTVSSVEAGTESVQHCTIFKAGALKFAAWFKIITQARRGQLSEFVIITISQARYGLRRSRKLKNQDVETSYNGQQSSMHHQHTAIHNLVDTNTQLGKINLGQLT